MSWFSKQPKPLVPRRLLNQLGAFGRTAWESKINGQALSDPRFDWANFLSGFLPAYQAAFDRMVAEIHAAAGDDPLARYGGYRVIAEFEADSESPLYLELMDSGLDMMFDRGMSSGSLTGFEAQRWTLVTVVSARPSTGSRTSTSPRPNQEGRTWPRARS